MSQCKFQSKIGDIQCEEQALSDSTRNYCIFHEELENKDIEKCMKFFYEKVISGQTNFEGFILKDVDFSKVGITQIGDKDNSIWFNNAKFNGFFSANGIKFIGFTSFQSAEFKGESDFTNTTFTNTTIFDNVKFLKKVKFQLANFFREARFSNTAFSEISDYTNVTFRGPAFFSNALFNKTAIFNDVSFERGGSFSQSKMDFALFKNSELQNVTFDEVNITNFKFHGAKLKDSNLSGAVWNSPWKSPWRKFILREDIETIKAKKICEDCLEIVIDETDKCENCEKYFVTMDKDFLCPTCNIKNKINSKECINKDCDAKFTFKIKNNNYSDRLYRANLFNKAENIYRNIKLNLQDNGDYKTAGEFNFNELIMRRKRSYHERNIVDWLFSHLNSKLCGYGERANRVISMSLIVVFSLALAYFLNNAIIREGLTSYNPNFLESLYFSFVTFTTLGYGDYAPTQTFQLVATAEAFFGAFMIALFVLVFGRKMLR